MMRQTLLAATVALTVDAAPIRVTCVGGTIARTAVDKERETCLRMRLPDDR